MKVAYIAIAIFFISPIYTFGQDKELPISVEIELLNEYVETYEKEVFDRIYPLDYFVIPGDSAIQHYYNIEITIENKSSSPIFIWLMSCSWFDNFIFNNNYMFLGMDSECDNNRPVSLELNPNQRKIYNITLRKHIKFDYPGAAIYGYGVETTQLGLLVVNDIYQKQVDYNKYHLGMEDKSKWKIVWSNPLHLHKYK